MFLVCVLLLNFYGYDNPLNFTGKIITGYATKVTDPSQATPFIKNLFTSWQGGNLDVNIAKYLFFFMITMVIFVVLNSTGIPEHVAFQWLFAIPSAFLATAYLTPAEVFSILTTWTALGITLSVLAPFALMMLGSAFILSPFDAKTNKVRKITVGQIIFIQVLWVGFLFFLFYKIFAGFGEGALSTSGGLDAGIIIIAIVFASTFLAVIFNKKFRGWIRNIGYELRAAEAEAVHVAADIERSVFAEEGSPIGYKKKF